MIKTASCLIIGFINMVERQINNNDVPLETLFKWQCKEVYKLQAQLRQKNKTIDKLKKNITLLLRDPEIKYQLSREFMLREQRKQISALQKELHRVREADRKILQTLLSYKLKEQNEQSGLQSVE